MKAQGAPGVSHLERVTSQMCAFQVIFELVAPAYQRVQSERTRPGQNFSSYIVSSARQPQLHIHLHLLHNHNDSVGLHHSAATMNEDDIAVMMADLGHQRRDAVVAPEDGKRQGPFMDERDKMLDAAEELMLRQKKLRGPAQNEKHEKLQKWNTPAIFGKDDIAEQQPDRYHGQGHRAYLAEKVLQYNRTPDGGGGNRGGRGGGSIRGKGI